MVNDNVMPTLPLSVMNVMDGMRGTQDMVVVGESATSEASAPVDYVVSGAQIITLKSSRGRATLKRLSQPRGWQLLCYASLIPAYIGHSGTLMRSFRVLFFCLLLVAMAAGRGHAHLAANQVRRV